MLKKLFLTAIVVAIVVGAIVYAKLGQFAAMDDAAENMLQPPETVTAMTVEQTQWELMWLHFTGQFQTSETYK